MSFDDGDAQTLQAFVSQRARERVESSRSEVEQNGLEVAKVLDVIIGVSWDPEAAERRKAECLGSFRVTGKSLSSVVDERRMLIAPALLTLRAGDRLVSSMRGVLEEESLPFVQLSVRRQAAVRMAAGLVLAEREAEKYRSQCEARSGVDAALPAKVMSILTSVRDGHRSRKVFDGVKQAIVDPLPADSRAIVARVFAGDGGFADFQTGWKSAWESSSDWVQELVAGVEELRDVRRSARRATIAKWGRLHKATHFGGPKLSKRGRDVIDTYLYLTDTASRVASFDRAYTRQTAADMVLQAWKDATQMTWDEVRNAVEPDDAVISPYGCPEDELLQVTFGVGSDEPREMARRAITTAKCRQQSMDDDSIGLGQSMR